MRSNPNDVVKKHITTRTGDCVTLQADVVSGSNVRGAEDDYARGQLALPAGRIIDAGAIGVLAGFGVGDVLVRRRPRIAVVVTGSELQPAGAALANPGTLIGATTAAANTRPSA